jgi:hypothetical protein
VLSLDRLTSAGVPEPRNWKAAVAAYLNEKAASGIATNALPPAAKPI